MTPCFHQVGEFGNYFGGCGKVFGCLPQNAGRFFHAQCGFQAFTHFALPCTCLRRDGACGADMELTIIVLKSRPLS